MPILYIMVGIPGSGKSSYAAELRERGNCVVNSSDAIREELYGSADDQSHNAEIFNTMLRRSVAALAAGLNCVYDATNLSAKRRANLISEISRRVSDVKPIAVVIATPITECLKRNMSRERHVPTEVIHSMAKRFEMPAYWEGFEEIRVYGNESPHGIKAMNDYLEMAVRMEQDNPNHSLTVGHHMQKAYALYNTEAVQPKYAIAQALYFHDIGKIYCKTFRNSRGELTDIGHFYNHENIGAYLYLSLVAVANINGHLRPSDETIVNLIQHHMDFFKGEKYLEKIKERFGKTFFDQLKEVHKYDLLAH